MLPVLLKILSSGQLCSVPGRNIITGAHTIISFITYEELNNVGAAFVSLDMWKAFDWVYIPFLLSVMRRMGFGPRFLAWVQMFHSGNSTRFLLSRVTYPIDIIFSVRQGDPAALIFYLIYVEPLFKRILLEVRGISIGNAEIRNICYVDDGNNVLAKDEDFLTLDKIYHQFEQTSGTLLQKVHGDGPGSMAGED